MIIVTYINQERLTTVVSLDFSQLDQNIEPLQKLRLSHTQGNTEEMKDAIVSVIQQFGRDVIKVQHSRVTGDQNGYF